MYVLRLRRVCNWSLGRARHNTCLCVSVCVCALRGCVGVCVVGLSLQVEKHGKELAPMHASVQHVAPVVEE